MKHEFFIDLETWGVGFDIGTTKYSPYRYAFSVTLLCASYIVWFGKAK